MRICFVGAGHSTHHPARALPFTKLGHDVRLVTLGAAVGRGIDIVSVPEPRPGSLLGGLRSARHILQAIKDFKPDVLHAHYAGRLASVASLSGLRPFVLTVMGGDVLFDQHEHPTVVDRWATRRLLDRADLILTKSEHLGNLVRQMGNFDEKTHTVVWGVDLGSFPGPGSKAQARHDLGLPLKNRVVLSPRILRPLYNIHVIVEAMPLVLQDAKDALLLITEYRADAQYRERLKRRIFELGLGEQIRFVGVVEPERMPSLYAASDVVVSVPASDGLPQSVLEAMACGVPVVSGNLPSYDGVLTDGETALRVALEPHTIASGIQKALEPRMGVRLTKAARAFVEREASLEASALRVEALYQGLLARGRLPKPRWLTRAVDAGLLLR